MAGGVGKYYTAVLEGRLEDDLPASGIIDLPIGLAKPGEPGRAVIQVEEGGYPSQTEYEILQTMWDVPCVLLADDDCEPQENQTQGTSHIVRCEPQENQTQGTSRIVCTVVRARLLTGRTHQIRVHFAYYGHPVLGDHLYGGPTELIGRQALHAEEIAFAHPVTGQAMRITAPLPEDIALLF